MKHSLGSVVSARVCGIPAKVITAWEDHYDGNGPVVVPDKILTRKGKRAEWLERKLYASERHQAILINFLNR